MMMELMSIMLYASHGRMADLVALYHCMDGVGYTVPKKHW